MVKKPIGDGTHLKKGRVVVCGSFQQVQPGEETCANTPSFPMLRTKGLSCSSLVAHHPVGGGGHTKLNAEQEPRSQVRGAPMSESACFGSLTLGCGPRVAKNPRAWWEL